MQGATACNSCEFYVTSMAPGGVACSEYCWQVTLTWAAAVSVGLN